jgi:uncharacterized integral membrane protein (TIGR00698 family)
MALLIGIAFNFLSEDGRCAPGIGFTSRTVLRAGVALLGVRISFEMIADLGVWQIAMVIVGVVATIIFGLGCARLLGRGWRFGLLTGGAVAICGASAAMAIAAVLPRNEHSERNLIFTVLGVTILSTVAMIGYPVLTRLFGLDDQATGVFLGGAIHDVAQVVGAGFSVSEATGETATTVKLIRVTMLAPVVLVLSLLIRSFDAGTEASSTGPPIIPSFVIGFLIFAAMNSFALIPQTLQTAMSDLSRWALLTAIAAVGVKTSLRTMTEVGGHAIVLIIAETVFLGGFILLGIKYVQP